MLEIVFTHFVWYLKIEFRPVYGETERIKLDSKQLGLLYRELRSDGF